MAFEGSIMGRILCCQPARRPRCPWQLQRSARQLYCDWARHCCFLCPLPGSSALLCGICIQPFVNSSQIYFKYSRILYNLSGIHNKDALIPKSFSGIQRTCLWDAWFTFPFKESVVQYIILAGITLDVCQKLPFLTVNPSN